MKSQLSLFDIVAGKDVCPAGDASASEADAQKIEDAVEAWQQRDAEARYIIIMRLEPSQHLLVTGCPTAKEEWDALQSSGRWRRASTSMRAHTAAFLTDIAKLGQLGMPVPDTFLGMFMLLSVSGGDARTVLLAVDQGEELEATRIASCLEASRARGRGRNADSDGARSHRTADGDLAAGREFEN